MSAQDNVQTPSTSPVTVSPTQPLSTSQDTATLPIPMNETSKESSSGVPDFHDISIFPPLPPDDEEKVKNVLGPVFKLMGGLMESMNGESPSNGPSNGPSLPNVGGVFRMLAALAAASVTPKSEDTPSTSAPPASEASAEPPTEATASNTTEQSTKDGSEESSGKSDQGGFKECHCASCTVLKMAAEMKARRAAAAAKTQTTEIPKDEKNEGDEEKTTTQVDDPLCDGCGLPRSQHMPKFKQFEEDESEKGPQKQSEDNSEKESQNENASGIKGLIAFLTRLERESEAAWDKIDTIEDRDAYTAAAYNRLGEFMEKDKIFALRHHPRLKPDRLVGPPERVRNMWVWSGAAETNLFISMLGGSWGAEANKAIRPFFYDLKSTLQATRFTLTKPGAVAPSRPRVTDAGFDLTLIELLKSEGGVDYYSTGVVLDPPSRMWYMLVARSKMAKMGWCMANGVGIIDAEYRGEVIVALRKTREDADPIQLPATLVQVVPQLWFPTVMVESDTVSETSRGATGGLGSAQFGDQKAPPTTPATPVEEDPPAQSDAEDNELPYRSYDNDPYQSYINGNTKGDKSGESEESGEDETQEAVTK